MALEWTSFEKYLKIIKAAILGKDMRDSIHDALDYLRDNMVLFENNIRKHLQTEKITVTSPNLVGGEQYSKLETFKVRDNRIDFFKVTHHVDGQGGGQYASSVMYILPSGQIWAKATLYVDDILITAGGNETVSLPHTDAKISFPSLEINNSSIQFGKENGPKLEWSESYTDNADDIVFKWKENRVTMSGDGGLLNIVSPRIKLTGGKASKMNSEHSLQDADGEITLSGPVKFDNVHHAEVNSQADTEYIKGHTVQKLIVDLHNQETQTANDLKSHKSSNPIDHADGSITKSKLSQDLQKFVDTKGNITAPIVIDTADAVTTGTPGWYRVTNFSTDEYEGSLEFSETEFPNCLMLCTVSDDPSGESEVLSQYIFVDRTVVTRSTHNNGGEFEWNESNGDYYFKGIDAITGDLTTLSTKVKENLVKAINEIHSQVEAIDQAQELQEDAINDINTDLSGLQYNVENLGEQIGDLPSLTTSNQDCLVDAINEVDAAFDGIGNLQYKLEGDIRDLQSKIEALQGEIGSGDINDEGTLKNPWNVTSVALAKSWQPGWYKCTNIDIGGGADYEATVQVFNFCDRYIPNKQICQIAYVNDSVPGMAGIHFYRFSSANDKYIDYDKMLETHPFGEWIQTKTFDPNWVEKDDISTLDFSYVTIGDGGISSLTYPFEIKEGKWILEYKVPETQIHDKIFGSFSLPSAEKITFSKSRPGSGLSGGEDSGYLYARYDIGQVGTYDQSHGKLTITLESAAPVPVIKEEGSPVSYLEITDGNRVTAAYIYLGWYYVKVEDLGHDQVEAPYTAHYDWNTKTQFQLMRYSISSGEIRSRDNVDIICNA